ncbi:phosphoribosylamine--glycine ligase [Robiginitalea myxolifaciens]|uniref:Phosphoribosylamine--glycine ligase n=1 Tax=Robiginitalea myxolifaciens TaxID=400055 RepID=A0A1I6G2D5_9FLAO|nr:phosphoribosylamine--glycine ligase [Robiginitalea myxolifaciens]SFR36354.1 phosphoribosylamine--glycine ligase [Robiginitalea myxolifaciens]
MNILVLGSGGREHALAWKISQSPLLDNLYIAPGNAGTAAVGTNLDLGVSDFAAIGEAVLEHGIDLVLVGPEVPLVEGIHDYFLADAALKEVPVIGPAQEGARLEGSKEFAKEFMMRHGIPTAAYKSFGADDLQEAFDFLETLKPPYVLKADGLAAGKGVLIIEDKLEAQAALKEMLVEAKFGAASARVVIEEFLSGIELSCFVLTDGISYKVLPTAKDYKRIGEGDTGLNTGGMGAVSPVPFADTGFMEKIESRIIKPTIEGLKQDSIPYVGFIFIGLIKVGYDPYVIEYNVRMGDPETEAVIPRIASDLVEVLQATANGTLSDVELKIRQEAAATVVMVSGGYPESYDKGYAISGLTSAREALVFHAGTRQQGSEVQTSGGRVLAVTGLGSDFRKALQTAYNGVASLDFEKANYRKDIGFDL